MKFTTYVFLFVFSVHFNKGFCVEYSIQHSTFGHYSALLGSSWNFTIHTPLPHHYFTSALALENNLHVYPCLACNLFVPLLLLIPLNSLHYFSHDWWSEPMVDWLSNGVTHNAMQMMLAACGGGYTEVDLALSLALWHGDLIGRSFKKLGLCIWMELLVVQIGRSWLKQFTAMHQWINMVKRYVGKLTSWISGFARPLPGLRLSFLFESEIGK